MTSTTEQMNDCSILLCLPDELITCILQFAGPNGTASTGITCKKLNKLDHSSNALWFRFAKEFFRQEKVGGEATPWRDVYVCCARVKLESLRSSLKRPRSNQFTSDLIQMRHVYDSDRDKVYSGVGYGVENVLCRNMFCWSTSPNMCQNVDLVTTIIPEDEMALITSIDIVTPPLFVADCPPKTVLAFVSSDTDNTEAMLKNSYRFNKANNEESTKKSAEENRGTRSDGNIATYFEGSNGEPDARINVPPMPDCHEQIVRKNIRPVIGRTFLFKILEAYNPNGHSDHNVDIEEICVHGHIVPGLAALLSGKKG